MLMLLCICYDYYRLFTDDISDNTLREVQESNNKVVDEKVAEVETLSSDHHQPKMD